MSTRQNKKRKGRGAALNRERTVTTLTDGTEATFSSLSPADDLTLLTTPYSVNPPSAGAPTISSAFSMSGFPYQYNYVSPMSASHFASQQAMYNPQSLSSPGTNDLEVLERLKEEIKSGQHPLFQPVPRPSALAAVYLGPRSVPPHPEQVPGEDRRQFSAKSVEDERRLHLQSRASVQVRGSTAASHAHHSRCRASREQLQMSVLSQMVLKVTTRGPSLTLTPSESPHPWT